ncbi:MAG: methionine--tRNA ligase [Lentisphaerae bacterium]|jgi:methionyl-tRNA synthetase|nr:methionine--tRNA ligase [Lentisphaerota bacterium]
MQKRRLVVTAALPYANGDIHIGHLVEYLQTDFWVRFHKMRGHECVYICADDTHGTPIMLRARQDGITPEELIAASYERHVKDFADFEIEFDNFYSTNSQENREFCETIFDRLKENNAIIYKNVPQLYCPNDKMFLPDRFVKGTCPKCDAADQYGDSCESCGTTYSPVDMKDARCAICNTGKPEIRDSEQIFFNIELYRDYLIEWLSQHVSKDVANKLLEWFEEDTKLLPWNISRDAPYFGFEIPGHPGKFFYVWLDAPVGYMASLLNWCNKNNENFDSWWNNRDAELYHFIGKDIVRFHCLFWPALLHSAGYKGPTRVFVHGFLTVNGEKMSKSRGTFINARTYLDHLNPAYLRYYYACKINNTTDDVDLNFEDFVSRVNSDLVGKITNLASRGAQMLNRNLEGKMGVMDAEGRSIVEKFREKAPIIAEHYENRRFSQVPVEVCRLADMANEFFDRKQPWNSIKTDLEETRKVITSILNMFRLLAIYLTPVLPEYSRKVSELLKEDAYTWKSLDRDLENQEISKYEYLAVRVGSEQVEKIIEATKKDMEPVKKQKGSMPEKKNPLKPEIDIDQFNLTDLRVALVETAEVVEGSDKLIRLSLDLGHLGKRSILSGIRDAYPDPSVLNGKLIIVVANLKPRKMRFGVSEGMVLSAGGTDTATLRVISPLGDTQPGDPIG